MPEQVVPRAGTINVPFAGDVKVAGVSPRDIERIIAKRLASKAVDPQVLVSVTKSKGNSVTVSGDAVTGAKVPIGPNNERILDAIAISGGLKAAAYETSVTLVRSNRSVTLPFSMLIQRSTENIRLGPGDVLFITRRARTYTILGATGKQAEVPFDAPRISLTQAIARAGGLLTIGRCHGRVRVPVGIAAQIQSLIAKPLYIMPGKGMVPVVYRLNLREPKVYSWPRPSLSRKGIWYLLPRRRQPSSRKSCKCLIPRWLRWPTEPISITPCIHEIDRRSLRAAQPMQ